MPKTPIVFGFLVACKSCCLQRIPEAVQQKYTQQPGMNAFLDRLQAESSVLQALKTFRASSQRTSPGQSPTANTTRTLATPDWQGDGPLNVRKRIIEHQVPLSEFEGSNAKLR